MQDRDFHTLDLKDQERDRNTVENLLSKVEAKQDRVLRKLLSSQMISEEIRGEICFFVNLMYHRVPSFKDVLEDFLKQNLKATAGILLRNGKFPEPPGAGREVFETKNFTISNWKLVEMMLNQARCSPITSILKGMQSAIATSSDPDSFFATSDVPVVLYDPTYDFNSPYGTGFGTPSVEISIPISASQILIFHHSELPSNLQFDSEQVHEMNRRMIVSCNRFLYLNKPSERLLEDIEILWDQKVGPKSPTINSDKGSYIISKQIPVSPLNFPK